MTYDKIANEAQSAKLTITVSYLTSVSGMVII